MNHRIALCLSLTVFLFLYTATPSSAAADKDVQNIDAVFSESFNSMNIPEGDGHIAPQTFETIASYLLESERYDWLSFYIGRAPDHYFTHYAEFRVFSHYGHSDRASSSFVEFAVSLLKEQSAKKTEAIYDAELSIGFSWLRKHEFDSERKLLEQLCKALPHNYALKAESLRWIDWLDGRPYAAHAIEKIRQNEKSDYRILAELASIYAEWSEPDRAVHLLLEAWQRADSDKEIMAIYIRSVAIGIPALAKKLAERILKKDRSINTLERLYEDGNISKEKLAEFADAFAKQNSVKSLDRIALAELLLKARDRKRAVKMAESIGSDDSVKKLTAEARLFSKLLNGEVEQDKLKQFSEKRIDAIRRLSAAPELKASSAYLAGALTGKEGNDPEAYKILRPFIEKLREKYSGVYMQIQELRLQQKAGKNAEVLAGLDSLYNQHTNKPMLQVAIVSEAIRFIEDGLEDNQDGRLRKWCEDKAMACADANKDSLVLSACACLLDRIVKRGEAANVRQKLSYGQEVSTDLIIEMGTAMYDNVPHERTAAVLARLESVKLDFRQKLLLIEMFFRCDEQERATSIKYSLASENIQNDNLVLARRLIVRFESYKRSLSYLTQPARISLDVFSHQIIMLLRKHCEKDKASASDFAEAFSILRRMQNDPNISDPKRDSETRFYLWNNAGAVEDAIHNIFESLPASKEKSGLPPGVANELARLSSDDFLQVLSSEKDKGTMVADDLRELIMAAALKSPDLLSRLDELIDKWKSRLELKGKDAEFFEMAVGLNSAALAAKKQADLRTARYRKISNRMESEIDFLQKWKNAERDSAQAPANNPDATGRLSVRKDPRLHILSAEEVETAVAESAWIIERCFDISHDKFSPEFSGFIITDNEGFVENADIYSLNSGRDLQTCIKERLHAIYIADFDSPFAYARLNFKYIPAEFDDGKSEKDFGLYLAELERLKSSAETRRKSWADWPGELFKRSDALTQLALDLSSDSSLQKKIAGWQYINGREEEARHTLHQAVWSQIGNWLGIMAAILAALWLAAYLRKRIKETGKKDQA